MREINFNIIRLQWLMRCLRLSDNAAGKITQWRHLATE